MKRGDPEKGSHVRGAKIIDRARSLDVYGDSTDVRAKDKSDAAMARRDAAKQKYRLRLPAELTRVVSFEDLDGGDSGTGSAGSKRKADAPLALAVSSSADDDETAS